MHKHQLEACFWPPPGVCAQAAAAQAAAYCVESNSAAKFVQPSMGVTLSDVICRGEPMSMCSCHWWGDTCDSAVDCNRLGRGVLCMQAGKNNWPPPPPPSHRGVGNIYFRPGVADRTAVQLQDDMPGVDRCRSCTLIDWL